MVSSIPTFSFKKVNIKREYVTPMLMIAGMIIAGMILEPWLVLPMLGMSYIAMIPISIVHYHKYFKKKIMQ
jgi:CDP-diacylglycerol--serine O-phosphatidyltransferase